LSGTSIRQKSFFSLSFDLHHKTMICKFRHLIEAKGLSKMMLTAVNDHLKSKGIKIGTGTIMDATLISAPSSTKNEKGERDPEMHQTRKSNQWYFGLKGHIGVDSKEKVIHSTGVTSANVQDSQMVSRLLHGAETKVWDDTAYQGHCCALHPNAYAARHGVLRRRPYMNWPGVGGRRVHRVARGHSKHKNPPRGCATGLGSFSRL
jgi:IS5 family transposase